MWPEKILFQPLKKILFPFLMRIFRGYAGRLLFQKFKCPKKKWTAIQSYHITCPRLDFFSLALRQFNFFVTRMSEPFNLTNSIGDMVTSFELLQDCTKRFTIIHPCNIYIHISFYASPLGLIRQAFTTHA